MNSRFTLRAGLIAAGALFTFGASAQERAVESTHFEFGFGSSDRSTSGSTSSGAIGAGLKATVPLGPWFGVALGGDYVRSRIRTREVLEDETGTLAGERPSCDFDSVSGDVSLFFRQPSFGKVAITYGIGDLSADCRGGSIFPATGGDSLGTDTYGMVAEAYFGNFTVTSAYVRTSLENGPELKSKTIGASWYPLDSLKLSMSGGDLYDEDSYGVFLEHQPEIFGDGLGVRLGFSMLDASPRTRTVEIGLSYYFGRKIALKTRDRLYR